MSRLNQYLEAINKPEPKDKKLEKLAQKLKAFNFLRLDEKLQERWDRIETYPGKMNFIKRNIDVIIDTTLKDKEAEIAKENKDAILKMISKGVHSRD